MTYAHPITGKLSPVPWDKDVALALKVGRYMIDEKCPECKCEPIARYVDSNECVQCADTQSREDWRLWQQGIPGRPDPFPTTMSEAVKFKVDYHYVPRLCKGGHHFIKKHIKTGKCVMCIDNNKRVKSDTATNRFMKENCDLIIDKDTAASMGLVVFKTGAPCRKGHIGWRYVNGGACLSCMRPGSYPLPSVPVLTNGSGNKTDARRSISHIYAEEHPNSIMDKETAKFFGLKLYRTGKPCNRGHRGWRYVSTNNCVDCR
jgi:hypothetical protein